MNKNTVYLAIFAALCVLTGVLVGASITRKARLPWYGPGGPNFAERAERFMGHGPKEFGESRGPNGLVEMLAVRLGLSTEQKVKVTEILEKKRQEIEEIGKNLRNAITAIKEGGDRQIMRVLTISQQEKFKALQKEFERGCGMKGQGEGRGPMGGFWPPPGEEAPPRK